MDLEQEGTAVGPMSYTEWTVASVRRRGGALMWGSGETSRNLYTRAKEHMNKYLSRKTRAESFIHTHQNERHTGLPAQFEAKVVGNFKDCLSRQVSEGVHIRRGGTDILNSKSEWHQPSLWRVQSELRRE